MLDARYSVSLPKFEGSLDLLLHLIKSNKIDIYDIPIALITNQYLEYLDIIKELDLDIASDFMVMAATLIYIKSRMLLPPDETAEDVLSQGDDPRKLLVERLLEYQAFKEASHRFKEMEEKRGEAFSRSYIDDSSDSADSSLFLSEISMFDLMEAVKKILQDVSSKSAEISRDLLTVKDRMAFIMEKIQGESAVAFQDFFSGQETRIEVIVTFIALLEVLKMRIAKAFQKEEFGNIWICKCSFPDKAIDL